MGKTKYQSHYMNPICYRNRAAMIETMAKQGWMVQKVTKYFIKYKQAEPTSIRCHIALFEIYRVLHAVPVEERRQFCERWLDRGWTLVSKTMEFHVFITTNCDAQTVYFDQEEAEITRKSYRKKNIGNAIVLLLLLFVTFGILNLIKVTMLLTSNLPWLFFAFSCLLLSSICLEWLVYRNWNNKTFDVTQDENSNYFYVYSDRCVVLYTSFYFVYFSLYGLLLFVLMQSLSMAVLLSHSAGIIIGSFFGYGLRHYINQGKTSEEHNLISLIGLLMLLLIVSTFLGPMLNDLNKPSQIQNQEAFLLRDFQLDTDVAILRNDSEKSFFTRQSFVYHEAAGKQYIETKCYEFINHTVFEYYLKQFLLEQPWRQWSPATVGDASGYLNPKKTMMYVTKGNKFYLIEGSMRLDTEESLEVITNKLRLIHNN